MASFFKGKSKTLVRLPSLWENITGKPNGIDESIRNINEARREASLQSLSASSSRSTVKDIINRILLAPFMICRVKVSVTSGTSVFTGESHVESKGVWTVDYGDGTVVKCPMSQNAIPSHTYEVAGDYLIQVRNASLSDLGDSCFEGCTGLKSIKLPQSIIKFGSRCFFGCDQLEVISIPPYVTELGDSCFEGCTSIKTLEIPERVENIGSRCFAGCESITALSLLKESFYPYADHLSGVPMDSCVIFVPDVTYDQYIADVDGWAQWEIKAIQQIEVEISQKATLFSGHNTHVVTTSEWLINWGDGTDETVSDDLIPSHTYEKKGTYKIRIRMASVVEIGESCFSNVIGLTGISLPSGIITIGDNAFSDCVNLKRLMIPSSVTSIGDSCCEGCSGLSVELLGQTGRTELSPATDLFGEGATVNIYDPTDFLLFNVTSDLLKINVCGAGEEIGESCFENCSGLIKVDISSSTKTIGSRAFSGSSSFSKVDFPSTLTSIEDEAFAACKGLTSVVIPESVSSIGERCWNGCSALVSIRVSDKNETYDSRESCNAIVETDTNTLVVGCKTTHILDSIEKIGQNGFTGMGMSGYLVLPVGINTIENDCFSNNPALTGVKIYPSLINLGEGCFAGCTGLGELVLLGNAFYDYPNRFLDSVPSGETGCVIRVLDAMRSRYEEDASWGNWVVDPLDSSLALKVTVSAGATVFNGHSRIDCTDPAEVVWGDGSISYWSNGLWTTAYGDSDPSIDDNIEPKVSTEMPSHTYLNDGEYEIRLIFGTLVGIGENCFSDCTGLSRVMIPESVRSISGTGFVDCDDLHVDLYGRTGRNSSSVAEDMFGERASVIVHVVQDYLLYNVSASEMTVSLSADEIRSTGAYSFAKCSGLTNVEIPDGIESLGACSFQGDTSLTDVTIPETVSNIGNNCFFNCSGLNIDLLGSTGRSNGSAATDLFGTDATVRIAHAGDYEFVNISSDGLRIIVATNELVLGKHAFENCLYLKSVSFDTNIEIIEEFCFSGCRNLSDISLPESLVHLGKSAFRSCISIAEMTIPTSVSRIEDNCFAECSGITFQLFGSTGRTVNAPSSDLFGSNAVVHVQRTVNDSIFENVSSSYLSVFIDAAVTAIGSRAFYLCSGLSHVTVPNGVLTFGDSCFGGCYSLTSVDLPTSLISLGKSVFAGCLSLRSMTVPSNVLSIGDGCWSGCELMSIDLFGVTGRTAESLPTDLFGQSATVKIRRAENYLMSNVTSQNLKVILDESVTSIGQSCFANCVGLQSPVLIHDKINIIGDACFSGCSGLVVNIEGRTGRTSSSIETDLFGSNAQVNMKALNNYALFNVTSSNLRVSTTNGVETIGVSCFEGCANLTEVNLTSGISVFQDKCFKGCRSLLDIDIPDTIRLVGSSVFADCVNLSSISFKNGVESIGANCCSGCIGLRNLTIPSSVVQVGDGLCSNGCHDVIVGLNGLTGRTGSSASTDLFGVRSIINLTSMADYLLFNVSSEEMSVRMVGEDLDYVADHAFEKCSGLQDVVFSEVTQTIGISAFENCDSLRELNLPPSVAVIQERSFYGCSSLSSLQIPGTVLTILDLAFSNCQSLEDVQIEEGVTEIGNGCFEDCVGLKSISIPQSVEQLNESCLKGDVSLQAVRLNRVEFYDYPSDFMEGVPDKMDDNPCMVFVPYELIETYSNDENWSRWIILPLQQVITLQLAMSVDFPSVDNEVATFGNWSIDWGDGTIEHFTKEQRYVHPHHVSRGTSKITVIGAIWKKLENAGMINVLQRIEIPEGFEELGDRCFEGPSTYSILTTIKLPKSLRKLGYRTFANVIHPELIIPFPIENLPVECFMCGPKKIKIGDVPAPTRESYFLIGEGVRTIGARCFSNSRHSGYDCDVLIPSSVQSIGMRCFEDQATNVILKGKTNNPVAYSLDEGYYTFGESQSIELYTAPNGQLFKSGASRITVKSQCERIGNDCFGFGWAHSLTIEPGVKEIGERCFWECNVEQGTVELPNTIERIGKNAFGESGIRPHYRYTSPNVILNGVTGRSENSASEVVFGKVDALTLAQAVDYLLFNERGCKNIIVKDGVTRIGVSCFENCSASRISIPSSTSELGARAFKGCTSLQELTLLSPTKIEYSELCLDGVPEKNAGSPCSIYVPANLYESYANDQNWSRWMIKSIVLPAR